jgi:hypothetical protein
MRTSIALLCVLGAFGCDLSVQDKDLGTPPLSDLKCSANPDVTAPPAKCAAAKGLAGDSLTCVDFGALPDQTLMNPPPQTLAGWDFGNPADCWELAGGKLQIKDFSHFAKACAFQTPALSAADYNRYSSFTLAVVHTVDINKQKQSAAIHLGLPVDPQQIWLSAGAKSRQVTAIKIDKSVLPNGGSGMYQPLFQAISSAASEGYAGWQIESIALLGNP